MQINRIGELSADGDAPGFGGDRSAAALRFKSECRRRGIRVTAQRLAVYEALVTDPTHPTVESIYARLRADQNELSLATVYRILEFLERRGFSRRISTTGGIGRFEAKLTPHQHLVCRQCGRITDAEVESLERWPLPRRGLGDFIPESLDICILGTCSQCRRPRGRRRKLK